MKTLLGSTKTLPSPIAAVPLLGIALDVTLRLKNVKDDKLKQVDLAIKVGEYLCPQTLSDVTRIERHYSTVRECRVDV